MSTCWTEKQKKWKQHARDTAERRRRWEKIAAEQEEEEELKLKKALQQRKRELESKNRYLRQPQAKPPPPKRSFLIKGSKRPVDRHDEALTNQSRLKGVGTKPERERERLKAFIRAQRAALKGDQTVQACQNQIPNTDVSVAPPRGQWKSLKEEAGADLESILSRCTAKAKIEENHKTFVPKGSPVEVNKEQAKGIEREKAVILKSPRPPRPPVKVCKDVHPVRSKETNPPTDQEEPTFLRRGCVSTARHRPAPRMIFSADSLDGSAVELKLPEGDSTYTEAGERRDGDMHSLESLSSSPSRTIDASIDAAAVQEVHARDEKHDLGTLTESKVLQDDSIKMNSGRDERDSEISGSVLEAKYFGKLASKSALTEVEAGIEDDHDICPEVSDLTGKKCNGPLAWWCAAEEDPTAVERVEQNGTFERDFDKLEEEKFSKVDWNNAKFTKIANKNKLPKRDSGPNRYGVSTESFGKELQKKVFESTYQVEEFIKTRPEAVLCMKQLNQNSTYCSPRKPLTSDFSSPLDQSLGSAAQIKLNSRNISKQEVKLAAPESDSKKRNLSCEDKKGERGNVCQGIEGPLMCKGSYSQSVQDKIHSIDLASKVDSARRKSSSKKKLTKAPTSEKSIHRSHAHAPPHPNRTKKEIHGVDQVTIAKQLSQQMKSRQYKDVRSEDIEEFTVPAKVSFVDRFRNKQGMVTTLSMEENRLRQSLARLDEEYSRLAVGQIRQEQTSEPGPLQEDRRLTEENLLASLQRLDLHLKGFVDHPTTDHDYSETVASILKPEKDELANNSEVRGVNSTTPMGFKRRDVILGNGGVLVPTTRQETTQQRKIKSDGFVYRNLTKVAPTTVGSHQGSNVISTNERRNNVGFTNGKAQAATSHQNSAKSPRLSKVEGRENLASLMHLERGDGDMNKTPASSEREKDSKPWKRKPTTSISNVSKNEPVRRHLGDSGGKIVLSQAAKALLL